MSCPCFLEGQIDYVCLLRFVFVFGDCQINRKIRVLVMKIVGVGVKAAEVVFFSRDHTDQEKPF